MIKSTVAYRNKRVVLTHHNDHIGKKFIAKGRFYEQKMLNNFCQWQKHLHGGLILDIGANIGNHTIFFTKYLKSSVIAYEPHAGNFDLLKMNINNNVCSNSIAINKAITSDGRRVDIISDRPTNMGIVNIKDNEKGLPTATPKDIASAFNLTDLRLIKIDCEDSSLEVLEAFSKIIAETGCDVAVEAYKEEEVKRLDKWMKENKYFTKNMFDTYAAPTYHIRSKKHEKL